nr:cyclophilin-like fold protein [Sinisalibacter aestuarii]
MTEIVVIVDGVHLPATLDDTTAGRDFAALLPLELTLSDYHATEKIADLPRRLDTTDAPASYAAPNPAISRSTRPGAIWRSSTSPSRPPPVWCASAPSMAR